MTITVKDANGLDVVVQEPLAPGRAAAAASKPFVLSNEDIALIGPANETAPATDIAPSGLNGRLQRIAQRLTALFPASLGSKADAASLAVTQSTEDKAVAAAVNTVLGTIADTASPNGTIKAALRAIGTALGSTALDLGSGTAGTRTLRFFQDTAQFIGGSGAATAATRRVIHASDDPAVAVLGAQADAASATTTIKGALRAIATALGTTAFDLGIGTGGTRSQRVTIDTAQVGAALTAQGAFSVGAVQTSVPSDHPPIPAALATNTIKDGAVSLTPKFSAIAAAASGNNTVVAAVATKKIRVLAYNLMANGAVNAKFQTGAGVTDLTGLKYFDAAGAGITAPFNPLGWFETAAGALLNLNLSGAVAVGGELVYVEV